MLCWLTLSWGIDLNELDTSEAVAVGALEQGAWGRLARRGCTPGDRGSSTITRPPPVLPAIREGRALQELTTVPLDSLQTFLRKGGRFTSAGCTKNARHRRHRRREWSRGSFFPFCWSAPTATSFRLTGPWGTPPPSVGGVRQSAHRGDRDHLAIVRIACALARGSPIAQRPLTPREEDRNLCRSIFIGCSPRLVRRS